MISAEAALYLRLIFVNNPPGEFDIKIK